MKKFGIVVLFISVSLWSCNTNKSKIDVEYSDKTTTKAVNDSQSYQHKAIEANLPTIGLLMYDGVLQSEVIAASDVFAKASEDGEHLFNVITIAENMEPVITEEGMRFLPDYTFENCPHLTALFVPSAYDMYAQVHNEEIINFIQSKHQETDYIVSNCAGAQLIGKSGIAQGTKIVTWIGGGEQLQKDYPDLKVQNDSLITFVRDGKFLSSNGNLASYISSLELVEIMTSKEHRAFVESYLYLDRLQEWNN
ncbi:DJ-1/PfpI family protein [Nonlabens dokdonensis]|jgi:transcriptional regulator GlxA family with amidase domain|uniref:DJ-1/PfpI family protein-possibly a protease n=2 Tax=Nonlabens dokdonensis TaxID=328515 RepID=L7WHU9_NONDD|nr:DJ-1/PfpI family protein [Nonlabens dokdonensis]AGC78578.1 DJ-1/PfpI family protein-possibly a protease [Nonlabens dokdonensis DSW-6]PZX39291.1 DJ-1/PfpI family protein [Nonlabens dokdonensis]